jgi:hypothetical protein
MVLLAGVALVRVLWSAVAASMVVALSFSLMIRGLVRFTDLRAEGQRRSAALHGVLAFCGLAVFLGAVAYGLIVVTQNS